MPERDKEVEKATGGGWSSILPSRSAVLAIAGFGVVSALAPKGSFVDEALNAPMMKRVEKEQAVDDAGTSYGASSANALNIGGVGVIVLYQLVRRVAAPRLAAMARDARASTPEADADEPETEG